MKTTTPTLQGFETLGGLLSNQGFKPSDQTPNLSGLGDLTGLAKTSTL